MSAGNPSVWERGARGAHGDQRFAGDSRFQADELPDATWTICKHHGVVRALDESGHPSVGGMCSQCREEIASGNFYSCGTHGIHPKAKGRDGCPFKVKAKDGSLVDCLGKGSDPSGDEVERVAAQIRADWAREDAAKSALAIATLPGLANVGDRGAGAGGPPPPGAVPPDDPEPRDEAAERVEEPAAVIEVPRLVLTPEEARASWRDPFLEPDRDERYVIVAGPAVPEPEDGWRDLFLEP